jgi:hypothetical protein
VNTSSATPSRPAMKTLSSTTLTASSVSSLLVGSNRASVEATTTQPSDRTKRTSFTRTTSADTKVPHPTSNGRTRLSATSRQYYPTSPPQSTAKTSSAQTSGHTPSPTGHACTTQLLTQSSRIRPLASSTPISSSTHTTSIDSHLVTCSASLCRNTNAFGNLTSRTTSNSTWATRTVSKAAQ